MSLGMASHLWLSSFLFCDKTLSISEVLKQQLHSHVSIIDQVITCKNYSTHNVKQHVRKKIADCEIYANHSDNSSIIIPSSYMIYFCIMLIAAPQSTRIVFFFFPLIWSVMYDGLLCCLDPKSKSFCENVRPVMRRTLVAKPYILLSSSLIL